VYTLRIGNMSLCTRRYKLERDHVTGDMYEVRVYNRSHKLTVSGPRTTLTIRLAANDSQGWSVYGGRYLCRASNGYSWDQRMIIINVRDAPLASGTLRYTNCHYLFTV